MKDTDNALIVVDYQNSFIPQNEWGTWELWVEGWWELAPFINNLIRETKQKWWLIIATRDWHPQNHISFASNHPWKEVFDTLDNWQILWPDHCVESTPGWEYYKELQTYNIDHHIIKWYDADTEMYSWFAGKENIPGNTTERIIDILKASGIQAVKIVGLATDYCINATALDARKLGLNVEVFTQWIRWVSPEDSIKALEKMRQQWIKIIDSK